MEFYVDIADLDAIQEIAAFFPVSGFTTNPKILSKAKKADPGLFREYRKYTSENNLTIFCQVVSSDAEGMLTEAKALKKYFGEHFVVKIPAVKEGYRALRLCKKAGIPVLITAVHTVTQALAAAAAGADYVAPYIGHIDNMGADGVETIGEMLTVFRQYGYPCKVLGASFRTVDQIRRLALMGCPAVTLAPPFFDQMIKSADTDAAVKDFGEVWKKKFGDIRTSDLIPKAEKRG